MNIEEINRIEAEAAAEEAAEGAEQQQAEGGQVGAPLSVAGELADFLTMAANLTTTAFALPINQRFTPATNLDIAQAAVKLCEKYNLDPRRLLIGPDSALGAWLGFAVAIGLPGYAVFNDYKVMKAKEVKQEGVPDGEQASNSQQSSQ